MHKKLLKCIATVSLLAVLPVNAAMAAEMSAPAIDEQPISAKINYVNVVPRVMMEHYFDDYMVYYVNESDIPSTYYYNGSIGGAKFSGTLTLFNTTVYERGGFFAHYYGTVYGQS